VGDPVEVNGELVGLLLAHRYVPVIASLGIDDESVLNVNADVMACRIASALDGADLVIAGATAGVLAGDGSTIAELDVEGIDQAITGGTATAGMIAKLSACRTALLSGVASVRIVDGRRLDGVHGVETAPGTRLTAALNAGR
jgi:acetylglutamate kinase